MHQKLNDLAREIHDQNVIVGWWDEWSNKIDRYETAMMLVISELTEALEGLRRNLTDDHLPNRKMFDVELGDAMIRLLDMAGAYDVTFDTVINESDSHKTKMIGLSMTDQLFYIVKRIRNDRSLVTIFEMVACILAMAEIHKIDLFTIINEKREYNNKRADHKRENRQKSNGKKF